MRNYAGRQPCEQYVNMKIKWVTGQGIMTLNTGVHEGYSIEYGEVLLGMKGTSYLRTICGVELYIAHKPNTFYVNVSN